MRLLSLPSIVVVIAILFAGCTVKKADEDVSQYNPPEKHEGKQSAKASQGPTEQNQTTGPRPNQLDSLELESPRLAPNQLEKSTQDFFQQEQKTVSPPALTLVSPINNAKIPRRVCNITVECQGYADGTSLKLFVQNRHGIVYGQDCHPVVKNNLAAGFCYLGDDLGNGVGENFDIWLEDDAGNKSNAVTVTRVR